MLDGSGSRVLDGSGGGGVSGACWQGGVGCLMAVGGRMLDGSVSSSQVPGPSHRGC